MPGLALPRRHEGRLLGQPAEPEHERHQREEDQHAQADHLRRVAEGGGRGVLRRVLHDLPHVPVLPDPERAKPISPISHVNVTARMNSAYCERGGILPHWIAPRDWAPRPNRMSITVTPAMQARTASTW